MNAVLRRAYPRAYTIHDRHTGELLGAVINYGIHWRTSHTDGTYHVEAPTRRDAVAGLEWLMGRLV